ncbi:MAG: EAL domain-containing protein [Candidatus Thiodiazotropha taylori]
MANFGTGYSFLIHFHRLPFNVLKIDQNFVLFQLDDVFKLDIVVGVIRLAYTLQWPVVWRCWNWGWRC